MSDDAYGKEVTDDEIFDYANEEKHEVGNDKANKKDLNNIKEHSSKAILKTNINMEVKWGDKHDPVSLPSTYLEKIGQFLENGDHDNISASAESATWLQDIMDTTDYSIKGDVLSDPMDDPDSEWEQTIEHKEKQFGLKTPKITTSKNTELVGQRALYAARSILNTGVPKQVPLYHSGLWVVIEPPTEASIINLHHQLVENKIKLGRITSGIIFSNISVSIVKIISEFIFEHIKFSTMEPTNNVSIFDVIRVPDLYMLIWGLICSMNPRGYKYSRSCVTGCTHRTEDIINPNALMWTNKRALSNAHKDHMLIEKPRSVKHKTIKEYQSTLVNINDKKYTVSEKYDIRITLTTPTINEYINSGTKWVNDIEDLLDNVIGDETSDNIKEARLNTHISASYLRQYSHWIKEIEINTNVIRDADTINKVLSDFSSDVDIRDAIIASVNKYINNVTISVIGIPEYDCPVCKGNQNIVKDPDSPFTNIIPIEVITYFLFLIRARITRIAER